MITLDNLLELSVIPYAYHCEICKAYITEKKALGIRLDINYYFHIGHSKFSYAEFIHKMNSNVSKKTEI